MIPKVDSYFSEVLRKYLDIVLNSIGTPNECYIIDEALGNMEPGVLDKFKKSFNGAKKSIDITYAFPKQKEQVDARYVIYRGKLQETKGSIGLVEGVAAEARPANGENIATDFVPVQKDDAGYYVELNQPIYDLINIAEVSSYKQFVDWDAIDDDPNRVNLTPLIGSFLGNKITVVYNVADTGSRKDNGGVALGFEAKDSIVVQAVSNNEDTVRCLDSILKFVLILIRSTERDNRYYQLATISSDGLQVGDNSMDNPVYVIPTVVTYTVSYAVRNDTKAKIEKILLNGKE